MKKLFSLHKLDSRGAAHIIAPMLFIVGFGLVGTYMLVSSHADPIKNTGVIKPAPISSYYPNTNNYQTYYLNGTNYANSASPSASVLWFQKDSKDSSSFYQYNSGPSATARTDKPSKAVDTCNWDHLTSGSSGLTYDETSNTCGTNNNQITYAPGITFMPVGYSTTPSTASGGWQASGSSKATYTDKGKVTCKGTNVWNTKNLGLVTLSGNTQALWFQNNQATTWTSGYDATTGCGVVKGVDQVTNWQENFYLVQALPVTGTNTPKTITGYALAREVGGNASNYQATGHWDYDVWYSNWQPLP